MSKTPTWGELVAALMRVTYRADPSRQLLTTDEIDILWSDLDDVLGDFRMRADPPAEEPSPTSNSASAARPTRTRRRRT